MKNKTILIDLEKSKDPFSGLGQFCLHLKQLFDNSSLEISYWIPDKIQKLAKKIPFLLPRSAVFHAVHQDSPYFPWSKKTKYILTIHDLNALYEHTQFESGENYKTRLQKKINRAEVVTFISEFTKSEVEKNFQLKDKKLTVIYNGIALGDVSTIPPFKPKRPYLFSIGTIVPKKNFHTLIDFLKLIPDYDIVLAGTTFHPYADEMKKKINEVGLGDRFFLVGTVNEEEKLWYYQNTAAFIFPSLLEGFGLPVAEAMSLGLPLFLSDKTSLPEIGGSDAFYFHSFEANEMKKVFEEGMKTFSIEQKERLIKRSQKFSWEKSAHEYLELYKNLLQ